jgi:oligopeptide/dipeptide ABC transporter ATP-binding protein
MVEGVTPLLDIRSVSVSFRLSGMRRAPGAAAQRHIAVDEVSLTIRKGTAVGLVGESGCGKTTLGRAIARFQRIDSGTISLDGKDLSRLNDARLRLERRRMQMVFQNPYASLDPRMTVYDVLAEAITAVHRCPKKGLAARAASYLEQVGLDPAMMRKFPHEFSGGQRQRIAIARALAAEPALIIADEPVSSLDVSVAAQILNLLHDLRDRLHLTMLFISHDLSVVQFISHEIYVMYRGRIVESGSADDLFTDPHHPYTSTLLKAVPVIPDANTTAPFFVTVPRYATEEPRSGGCSFAPRCEYVQEQCLRSIPPLRNSGTADNRQCACFRAGTLNFAH